MTEAVRNQSYDLCISAPPRIPIDPTKLPGKAFIVREDGELARVSRQSFATEDEFQAMIARHPELLAGDLLTPEAPREWLLVARDSRGEPALRAPGIFY